MTDSDHQQRRGGSVCRLCGGGPLVPVPAGPNLCRACGHLQRPGPAPVAETVVATGATPETARHLEAYAADLLARHRLPSNAPVLEIGANDGTFLRTMQAGGARVLGVEPDLTTALLAADAGIDVMPRAFTAELARDTILEQRGYFLLAVANDVLDRIDDLSDMVAGVRLLLTPGGLFAFEVPSLLALVTGGGGGWDRPGVLSWHALGPLRPLLAGHGLELIEAAASPRHGGSLRAVAKVAGGLWPVRDSVAETIAAERRAGLHEPGTYAAPSPELPATRE